MVLSVFNSMFIALASQWRVSARRGTDPMNSMSHLGFREREPRCVEPEQRENVLA